MQTTSTPNPRVLKTMLLTLLLPLLALLILHHSLPRQATAASTYPTVYPDEFGYGFNVAAWDVTKLQNMGFNWIKVFNAPGSRLPVNVLLRVEANSSHMNDLAGFGNNLRNLAQSQKGYVDAYEIGNEPNLSAIYGWTTSPDASDYAALLCTAYENIKTVDPNAIIVSAGLAPTGRVQGNWEGHPGHDGLKQDEREFFKQFLAAGGGDCLDAVGYHNYGFSADYDAEPDVIGMGLGEYCENGFCFRGAEKIYEIMVDEGLTDKQVWTTEFGWIVEPPENCKADKSWKDREWQIVSEQTQADNLVGAFEYARANWPWLGAMFIFNLNFNQASYYQPCEQMRYYSVQGRPADGALTTMSKDYTSYPPDFARLAVAPMEWTQTIAFAAQPYTATVPLEISNTGTRPFTWTLSLDPNSTLIPTWASSSGSLPGGTAVTRPVTVTMDLSAGGMYTASLIISTTEAVMDAPVTVPLTLTVQPPVRALTVTPLAWTAIITPGQAPFTTTWDLLLENTGDLTVDWQATAVARAQLTPTLGAEMGTLSPNTAVVVPVTVTGTSSDYGRFTAAISLTADPGTTGLPPSIPLSLYVWPEVYDTYLPVVARP